MNFVNNRAKIRIYKEFSKNKQYFAVKAGDSR